MSWLRGLLRGFRTSKAETDAPNAISEDGLDAVEPSELRADQLPRKQRSEALLRDEAVPINEWLPVVESETAATLRSAREVDDRLAALVIVAFKASERPEQSLVETIIAERGYRGFFTPDELAFIADPNPAERARIKFSWRCEAAWVLLWALRHVDRRLGLPRDTCDVPFLSETVFEAADLAVLGLRLAREVLDETDLIYRCHWAVREASLRGDEPPAGLNPSVTVERHHALNWLVGYMDLAWDDVTTDT